jgi:hypothetical protein
MKSTHYTIALFSMVFLLFSCSKEQQISRRLVKKEGIWKITEVAYSYFENNLFVSDQVYSNLGTMEFKENGRGITTFIIPGQPNDIYPFSWTNSASQLIITYDGQPLTGKVEIMKILYQSKSEMRLEQTEENISGGIAYKDILVYKITK